MKNSTQQPSDSPENDVSTGHVRIFDTTLRDGEQAPGFSMDLAARLRMAKILEELGVDVLEAGFPQASPDDFAATAAVAEALDGKITACALARCVNGDIDTAGRAIAKAKHSRIHVFIATSPLHREYKLNMSKDQVLDTAVASIRRALELADEVEFSAEDAMRTEPEYLAEVFGAAIEAGATTLNAPDTVGYMIPAEIAGRFAWLRSHVKGAADVVFSCHCHDDLGMGVANSLAAVSAGARQVECTINGIGERAGNAALEEIAMALKVRASFFGATTHLDTSKLVPASRLLTEITGQPVQPNKAIVGKNAFAHESGIHQDGMLKNPGTYEIMRPQDVGAEHTTLVLGKHSGRAGLRARLEQLGFAPDDTQLDDIFANFKVLADKQHEIHDRDLETLAADSAIVRKTKNEVAA